MEKDAQDAATFRLPSTGLFLGLIPVFSGQARRGDLAAALLEDSRPKLDRKGRLRPTQVRTYIIYNGRESQARTSISLFQDDPLWREGELSSLIKRQFGASGLKHLLGLFIAAEEHGAHGPGGVPGGFVFDVNRHLDHLGYKRSNRVNGRAYHTTKHLAEARAIVALLCSLTVVQEIRLGARRGVTVKVRLLLDEASAHSWEDVVSDGEKLRERIETNEKLYLRINPHLFSIAAEGTRAQQNFYTHQLKKLARENAHTRALTLTLGVHLPIKFRMSGCLPVRYSARSFLRMAGVPEEEYTAHERLERIEKTLRYMVERGYLSAFETERYRYAAAGEGEGGAGILPAGRPSFVAGKTPALPAEAGERSALPRPEPESLPGNGRKKKPRMEYTVSGASPGRPDKDPLEEMWQVEAPPFLKQILAGTLAKRAQQGFPAAVSASRPERAKQKEADRKPADSQALFPGFELQAPPPHAGELLRHVRVRMGLSQGRLAKKLGITQAAISMAEAGKRPYMAKRLYEAARRLHPEA